LAKHIKRSHNTLIIETEEQRSSNQTITKKNSVPPKTIQDFINPIVRVSITREDIQNACALLCTVDGRPFSLMNDIGFKRILNPLIEGLGCENFTNPQNVSDDVVAKSKKVVEKIKEETKGKMIALKIDGLTHLNRSFIGVYA